MRRRLATYYQTQGKHDRIVISVPKGTYIPEFSWNQTKSRESEELFDRSSVSMFRGYGRLALFGLLASLAVFVGFWKTAVDDRQSPTAGTHPAPLPASTQPFLAVLPFTPVTGDGLEKRLSVGLAESLNSDLSKLKSVSVMASSSTKKLADSPADAAALHGATHLIRGSIEKEGDIVRTNLQLIDTRTAEMVWADRIDGSTGKLLDMQDQLATGLAAAISDHLGQAGLERLAHKRKTNSETLALFRQTLELMMPPNELARISAAQELFEHQIDSAPSFAGGFAGKSISHSLSVLFYLTEDPQAELAAAINYAQTAIDKDPDFALGHGALGFAFALSGKSDKGFEAAKLAVMLQPSDAISRWLSAMSYLIGKDPVNSIIQVKEALRLDPLEHRMPYLNTLGAASLANGQYSLAVQAFEQNIKRGGPVGPPVHFFRAVAYAQLGDSETARRIFAELRNHEQLTSARRWLKLVLTSKAEIARTMTLLEAYGFRS
ncbi:MAG: tetratricopeptide repeat protein [Geminicoccaceae bacterium]